MDLKEEDILGADIGRHWYYRSKAAALRRAVTGLQPRHILDVGAGSGFFSRHLLAQTEARSALCVDIGMSAFSKTLAKRRPAVRIACPAIADVYQVVSTVSGVGSCRITPSSGSQSSSQAARCSARIVSV